MGYSAQVKYKAMELWSDGKADNAVAAALGSQGHTIPVGTIRLWRSKAAPQDWHAFKDKLLESAQREANRILLRKQVDVHVQHFEDWQRIRAALLRSMSGAEKDEHGNVVWVQRAMTPAEVRAVSGAYKDIQAGQRLALGIPSDHIITEASAAEKMGNRAEDVLAKVGLTDRDVGVIGDYVAETISRARLVDDDDIERSD